MATKEYWLGSKGPFLYDDGDSYPDGETFQGIRVAQARIDEAPTSDNEVARQTEVDSQAELDQRYSLMVS